VGEAGDATPASGLGRFAIALDRLSRLLLWWILFPHLAITAEVAGHEVGIDPPTLVLTPLVLLALRDLWASVPPPGRRAFTPVLVAGTATAALDLTRSLVPGNYVPHGGPGSTLSGLVWMLLLLDVALFAGAMVRWVASVPPGEIPTDGLRRAWRRTAAWTWPCLAVTAVAVAATTISRLADGRSLATDRVVEIHGWGWPAVLALVAALLGPLVLAADSTTRTRNALRGPQVLRPRRRFAGPG
jgi:hypothetical protein